MTVTEDHDPGIATELDALVNEFARLLDAHIPRGTGAEEIGIEDGLLWRAVVDGGWLDLAQAEAFDGRTATMPELARFAFIWGRNLGPQPFSTTLLARRWLPQELIAEHSEVPLTVTVPVADELLTLRPTSNASKIAFGVAATQPVVLDPAGGIERLDDFAPSLVVGIGGESSQLSGDQQSELRSLLAAEAVGAAQECFTRARGHAETRIAYGRPITAFQVMRHLLADMYMDLDFARTALYWALNTTGEENRAACRRCLEYCRIVGSGAFQVFGGLAFTWDLGLHLYQRHIDAVRDVVTA